MDWCGVGGSGCRISVKFSGGLINGIVVCVRGRGMNGLDGFLTGLGKDGTTWIVEGRKEDGVKGARCRMRMNLLGE